jgi:hypothetical protein
MDSWQRSRWFRRCLVLGIAAGLVLTQPLRADEQTASGTALKWIPADAAFYSSLLRNREQVEAVTHSKAWAKLMALPLVQQGLQAAQAQLKNPLNPQAAEFLRALQSPENKQLLAVLGDMASEEIFIYGGESCVSVIELMAELNTAARFGSLFAQLGGKGPEAQGHVFLEALAHSQELIRIPDLVIGFRLRNKEPAQAQLKRLETYLKDQEKDNRLFKGRIRRSKLAGGDFLTVSLDGGMLPRQQLAEGFKTQEETPGEFDNLLKKLTSLKLIVAIGIRDDYFLVSVGESTRPLTRLGSEPRLADRPELKPLEQHRDKRLTSITFASETLRSCLGTTATDIDQLVAQADTALQSADLSQEQKNRIRKDLAALAKDVKTLLPIPGPLFALSYLTDRGLEGFSYDGNQYPGLDGSKPLTLLNHVGGSPLLAVVGNRQHLVEGYQLVAKWVRVADRYFDDLVVPKLNADQQGLAEQVAGVVRPAATKLDKITSQLFLPSLTGQWAFVLDAKITSKRWQENMPEMDKPAHMAEPAIVVGVRDAAKLRKAFADYRTTLNDLISKLHEQVPLFPDNEIPEAESRKVQGGTLFLYPLPEEWGFDKQILPNAGLGDDLAVITIDQSHTERLLSATPLKVQGGPLADLQKPRVGAVYFDWSGLITAASPWVQLAVKTGMSQNVSQEGEEIDAARLDSTLKQVRTILDLLRCLRTYSSSCVLDGKTLVTHNELMVQDR